MTINRPLFEIIFWRDFSRFSCYFRLFRKKKKNQIIFVGIRATNVIATSLFSLPVDYWSSHEIALPRSKITFGFGSFFESLLFYFTRSRVWTRISSVPPLCLLPIYYSYYCDWGEHSWSLEEHEDPAVKEDRLRNLFADIEVSISFSLSLFLSFCAVLLEFALNVHEREQPVRARENPTSAIEWHHDDTSAVSKNCWTVWCKSSISLCARSFSNC